MEASASNLISFFLCWLWLYTIIGIDDRSSLQVLAEADAAPPFLYFNTSGPLDCDPSENIPNLITTSFLVNEPFSFGCLSNNSTTYFLSVALSAVDNFPNTPVWVADRYHPIKDNASLSLDPQGNVVFRSRDGITLWSSDTVNAAGMRLGPDGNLIIFDNHNWTLWQSFDEPIDLLVPGQLLKPGSMLVAGFSSHVTPTGNFTAVMHLGGLIFNENSTSQPLPYYPIQYPLLLSTVNGVLTSPCNHTNLQVNPVNLTQIQIPLSPPCTPPLSNDSVSFDRPILFIRLDPDGLMRGYYSDHKPSGALFINSSKGLCGIPNACGPYGICDGSSCVCPGNQSSGLNFVLSGMKEYLMTTTECTPKFALKCDQQGMEQQQFLDEEKVDYFANDFIAATMITDSFESCKLACATNCSCRAAFYRKNTKECFLQESVLSMIRVTNEDYVGSMKLQAESSSSRSKSELRLIVGISIASVFSVFFFGMWYCVKGEAGRHKPLSKDDDELLSSLPGQPKRFSFKELQAATWEFSKKLGVGGFGSVYRGVFSDGSSVAVKQLESTTRNAQGLKEFRNEVIALSNINHQNLVHLRGFCAEGGHRLLVYEYVANGSLDTWLFRKGSESPGPPLGWKTRLSIAVHTARGLFFLHEQCRNRIVHLDVKPQNILLDENFVPKLSDFGLSRLIHEDQDTAISRMRGTPGYMAPECLILTDATEKSDVYSFGMVLLELVSGRKNVDVSRLIVHGDGDGWYFPALAARKLKEGHVHDILDKSLGSLPDDHMVEATRVIQIAFWCIQDQASIRPTMGNALLMLEGYSQVKPPPLSFHFGMRFHLSNTIGSNPHTPRSNITSPKKLIETLAQLHDHQHKPKEDQHDQHKPKEDQHDQQNQKKDENEEEEEEEEEEDDDDEHSTPRLVPPNFSTHPPSLNPSLLPHASSLLHQPSPISSPRQSSPYHPSPLSRMSSQHSPPPSSPIQASDPSPSPISSPRQSSPYHPSPLSRMSPQHSSPLSSPSQASDPSPSPLPHLSSHCPSPSSPPQASPNSSHPSPISSTRHQASPLTFSPLSRTSDSFCGISTSSSDPSHNISPLHMVD